MHRGRFHQALPGGTLNTFRLDEEKKSVGKVGSGGIGYIGYDDMYMISKIDTILGYQDLES
jgi:hypothetical protein